MLLRESYLITPDESLTQRIIWLTIVFVLYRCGDVMKLQIRVDDKYAALTRSRMLRCGLTLCPTPFPLPPQRHHLRRQVQDIWMR